MLFKMVLFRKTAQKQKMLGPDTQKLEMPKGLEEKVSETCIFCLKNIEISSREKEKYYVPALKAYLCENCHKDYERYKATSTRQTKQDK